MTGLVAKFAQSLVLFGPGMFTGTLIGRWSALRRLSTWQLCLGTELVTVALGLADALTWNVTDFHWAGIQLWAPLYVWIARRPAKPARSTIIGEIGPASRAFRSRNQ